jgi:hypothetical protein
MLKILFLDKNDLNQNNRLKRIINRLFPFCLVLIFLPVDSDDFPFAFYFVK